MAGEGVGRALCGHDTPGTAGDGSARSTRVRSTGAAWRGRLGGVWAAGAVGCAAEGRAVAGRVDGGEARRQRLPAAAAPGPMLRPEARSSWPGPLAVRVSSAHRDPSMSTWGQAHGRCRGGRRQRAPQAARPCTVQRQLAASTCGSVSIQCRSNHPMADAGRRQAGGHRRRWAVADVCRGAGREAQCYRVCDDTEVEGMSKHIFIYLFYFHSDLGSADRWPQRWPQGATPTTHSE